MTAKADIGVIGLAVMGQNLVLNMNDKGYRVAVFNRSPEKTDQFLAGPARGTGITGARQLREFVSLLHSPRKILLMVKAGEVVDQFIENLLPFLEPGDILIDGGNSHYADTKRRAESLEKKGLYYVGCGVSGGEEGARFGPSIMPGGSTEAREHVLPIFQAVAAKVEGKPCCDWVGPEGSGHFVKMVHNGIEYGDMQLICEAYHLLSAIGLKADELSSVFADWNKGELHSYLIEITSEIFAFKDEDGKPLVEKILHVAGQKGTGKWTGVNALELGVPLTLIAESVFSRFVSSMKKERVKASKILRGPETACTKDRKGFIQSIFRALYASKIISYAQGFMLLKEASELFHWDLHYGNIAFMWRGGCIIRSRFLSKITEAYEKDPQLTNLLYDSFFREAISDALPDWREVIREAVHLGIPVPCFASALAFYDGLRTKNMPQNLLQAQRDYFGAHTYQRIDRSEEEFFHTNWTGKGGDVASGRYNV